MLDGAPPAIVGVSTPEEADEQVAGLPGLAPR